MHNYVKAYIISFYIYTTIQKFGVSKISFMFLNEVCYVHKGCIYLIKL